MLFCHLYVPFVEISVHVILPISLSNFFLNTIVLSGLYISRFYPLEEGMATHSSLLTWRIPWTEEPGGL